MSIRRTVHLICDGCHEMIDDGSLGAETAEEARHFAKGQGAHINRPGGRDICSSCWTEGIR